MNVSVNRAAVNPDDLLSITLGEAFSEVAECLRQSTVQVRSATGLGCGSGVIWRADGLIVTNAQWLMPRQPVGKWLSLPMAGLFRPTSSVAICSMI